MASSPSSIQAKGLARHTAEGMHAFARLSFSDSQYAQAGKQRTIHTPARLL
jgi:hypothetical protein